MAGTYPKKNLFVTDEFKINTFFKGKVFNTIIIILFSLILTSTTLAQSSSSLSCQQTNNINQFKDSLILLANELNIWNVSELKKYLNQQVLENNNAEDTTNIKNTIRSSLTTVETYKELSKAYSTNINQYNYYEFFTSQVFCQHVEHLESEKTSEIFTAANSLLERRLLEKLINPYEKIASDSNLNKFAKIKKFIKNKKVHPAIPIILFSAIPRENNLPRKWEAGVSTSTYNTSTYNTVRASEDWTDLNNNFDGGNSDLDFRNENNPVHPYETLGVDDAYAYGFTGEGQMIALLDGNFCGVTHETFKRIDDEGRLIYDSEGNPVKEPGFIERQFKKIPKLLENITLPGSPFASKPQTPPLNDTPMPIKIASNTQQKDPNTNLTRTETALLSPTEQVIASRRQT